jgi:hypothetical protein
MIKDIQNINKLRNDGSKSPRKNPDHIYKEKSMGLKDKAHPGFVAIRKTFLAEPGKWFTLGEMMRLNAHGNFTPITVGKIFAQLLQRQEIESRTVQGVDFEPKRSEYRLKQKPGV